MYPQETIVAIATPPGRGGVGVIRLSGTDLSSFCTALLGKSPKPRYATYCHFRDAQGQTIDDGLALYFSAPRSFTGEDVLELQGHGGPVVMDMLVKRCLGLGARLARPGEFSQRAFLNDKLDLSQAEAIADLIDSESETAVRSALRSLNGEFSLKINQLLEQLLMLRIYVEAALDFPEEEIDFLADTAVTSQLAQIKRQLAQVLATAGQGRLLREGMNLVIAGQPNAGKSSLLNALSGEETAIVTEIPGTTRDILKQRIHLHGMPLHIIDTAGLRESDDVVEKEGIRRAWREIEQADAIVYLIDATKGFDAHDQTLVQQLPQKLPLLKVFNKMDLLPESHTLAAETLCISAKQADGIEALRLALMQLMGYQGESKSVFMARRRHLDALHKTQAHVLAGEAQLQSFSAGELLAEELRLAHDALGEITGKMTSDELLGEIFGRFCIGK